MSRKNKREIARVQTNSLTADEAEELFSKVDETGHTNVETAQRQRRHRHLTGTGVDIDPLSADDPSGSNVGKTIAKAAAIFVAGFFVLIVGTQLVFGYVRRSNTANLSTNVNVRTVASALRGGVEWGNGFTQFPEDFSVQEADENAGRVEVTVIDTTSETVLEALAGSQVQAAAFSTNALLNQNINTVTYHVQVYLDAQGKIATSSFFGFVKPSGNLTSLMTFVWTKTYTRPRPRSTQPRPRRTRRQRPLPATSRPAHLRTPPRTRPRTAPLRPRRRIRQGPPPASRGGSPLRRLAPGREAAPDAVRVVRRGPRAYASRAATSPSLLSKLTPRTS